MWHIRVCVHIETFAKGKSISKIARQQMCDKKYKTQTLRCRNRPIHMQIVVMIAYCKYGLLLQIATQMWRHFCEESDASISLYALECAGNYSKGSIAKIVFGWSPFINHFTSNLVFVLIGELVR